MRALVFLLLVVGLPALAVAPEPLASDPVRDADHSPAINELTIPSDGSRMPGLIYVANGAGPHPTVVLLHGFPGNEKNLDLAQALRRAGFNVVFFHYRGAWGAEGDYRISQLPDDVAAVLAYLRDQDNAERLRVDTTRLSLLGHSLGGWTSLAAGSRDDDVVCVGAIAPADVGLWAAGLKVGDENAKRLAGYADSLFMLDGFDSEAMVDDLTSTDQANLAMTGFGEGLKGKSVFLITGDSDPVTPADTMTLPASEAYAKAGGMKLRTLIISGDHSFSWSRMDLTRQVLNWARSDCR